MQCSTFEGTSRKNLYDTAIKLFYFLLLYISFYISKYHFTQLFGSSFNII